MKKCQREECVELFESRDKRKMYCSRSCAATVNNLKSPKRKPQGQCKTCSKAISSSLFYCSKDCRPIRRRTICKVDDCSETVVDRGMCRSHYNDHMAEYMTSRYHRRRNEFIESRGGKCERCNSTDRLELDHVDPDQKKYDIGKILSGGSEAKVQSELAKCQVLCYDCHKEKTSAWWSETDACEQGHLYTVCGGRNTRGSRYCKYCQYRNNAIHKGRIPKTFEEWIKTK